MYLPQHFSEQEDFKIRKLIEQNSFVTLISFNKESQIFVNHLPVIFSSSPGQEKILIGHMSKRNPQWLHFKDNKSATVIVQGAHTYITPTWYKSGRDVPTWNYAVVHLNGTIELIESYNEQVAILKQLTYFFEKANKNPWEFELPSDLSDEAALTSAIISFQFKIETTSAKFKLSQNRSPEDKEGIIQGLTERTDDMSKIIREMMLENK